MKKSIWGIILLLIMTFSLFFLGFELTTTSITKPAPQKTKAVTETFGAWIIIAGDRSDHDKQELIKYGCNKTYEALISIGIPAADIYYLGPDTSASQPYVDAESTRANIQDAIETWAATRVDATHALGIYMFDHGGIGYMCVPGTDITDTNLNSYLNTLEESTGCNRTILIYEACHSGSFINPVSNDNRIVVTATDTNHNSHVNADWTWAVFSESFWSSILECKTIGRAFEDAEADVHALGYGGAQFPWIDDDHDEVGHEVDAWGNLPNGGDGNDALNTRIASLIRCLPVIYVEWIPLRYWIPWWWQYIPIWAYFPQEILPDIAKVYARITPPGWEPPKGETDEEGTKLVGDVGVELIELTDRDGDGNYTGVLQTQFKDQGEYKINILARGKEGGFAKVESTYVTRNEEGTKPPDTTPPTIAITNPSPNAVVSDTINITAVGDDDQALDKIQIYLDDELIKEETMPSYYPYPEVLKSVDTWDLENGKHTITAKAIDKTGNSNDVSITVTVDNQLTIPTPGFTTLIFGCSLIAMTIYIFIRRRFNKK